MTDQMKLVGVRLSFPDLWKAKKIGTGEPKFGAAFLLDKVKDAEQIKNLQLMIIALAKEKFGGAEEVRKLREKNKLSFCLHEGSEKEYDGYSDKVMYLSSSSKNRPLILDRNRAQMAEEDGRPYAGCYVDAIVRIWVQDNEYGKKVNCELRGVQFVKDGEPFGVGPLDPDEFTDYAEGEEPTGKSGAEQEAEKVTGTKAKSKEKAKAADDNPDDEIKF